MKGTRQKALLVLSNGSVFPGYSFGYPKKALGEVCFVTSMTGYQEILTDPSYSRQLISFSYPMVGNYGINLAQNESEGIQAAGLIVKEYAKTPSNFCSQESLASFLEHNETPAIEGIDTRQLILMLRREGVQNGGIFIEDEYDLSFLEEVRSQPNMEGLDLASEAGTDEVYLFSKQKKQSFQLGVVDFGIKKSILHFLDQAGFTVKVFPARTSFEELSKEKLDCYFLSNGPGDPTSLGYAIQTIQALLNEGKPIFGICLGHQLIGLARGHKCFKLKFGHRGSNQPVRREEDGRVEITSQNHGFAVESKSATDISTTHTNLNDNTIEGFSGVSFPLMSVQYHPEASPGPQDSRYLFQKFFQMVELYYTQSHMISSKRA